MDSKLMYSKARVTDRQVNELIGLSHGILADGRVDQAEVEYLQKWLIANKAVGENPVIATLFDRVGFMLKDGVLDDQESVELFDTLKRFAGGEWEIGELVKSTTLPLDEPPPLIAFAGRVFCFTGTFAFGTRKDCESAVEERGGAPGGNVTNKTDYLVVGAYATDSWIHSSYGRKIESAAEKRAKTGSPCIIGESHWQSFLV